MPSPLRVVDLALESVRRRTERRDRIAAVHLLVHAAEERAHDIARILGDQIRAADTRPDVGAVHALDVEDVVEAAHEVGAHAEVQRQALDAASSCPARRWRCRGRAPPWSRLRAATGSAGGTAHGAGRRVVRIELPHALEREAVVERAARARRGESVGAAQNAGLELVRPAPPLLVVRQVASEHRHRRGLRWSAFRRCSS